MSTGEKILESTDLFVGLLNLFKGRGNNTNTDGKTSVTKGVFELAVKLWEQSGGSLKDEAELGKTLFADPTLKDAKLEGLEHEKIESLIRAMEPYERVNFRLVLFVLEPETITITTPEKKIPGGKDGKEKIIPGTSKTERTGVDFRINTLKGIAAKVKDDLSNVLEVLNLLRSTGILGNENKALRIYHKVKAEIEVMVCRQFHVNSIDEITGDMIEAKLKGIVFSNEAPRPKNLLLRIIDLGLIGGTGKAVPIFQGDGFMNALRRMLGIDTSHPKRRA